MMNESENTSGESIVGAALIRQRRLLTFFVPDAALIRRRHLIEGGSYSSKYGNDEYQMSGTLSPPENECCIAWYWILYLVRDNMKI